MSEHINEQLLTVREALEDSLSNNETNNASKHYQEMETLIHSLDETSLETQFLAFASMAKYANRIQHFGDASRYYEEALKAAGRIEGSHQDIHIRVYLEYAGLKRDLNQYEKAKELLTEVFSMMESFKWENGYEWGLAYRSLGMVFFDEKDGANAIDQFNQALSYFQKSVPETHLSVIKTNHLIADVYTQLGEYEKALETHQLILEKKKKVFGATNEVVVGETLLSMGEIYFYTDLKKARRTITEALKKFDAYKTSHMNQAKGNMMLGEIEETLEKLPRAIKYYKRALEVLDNIYQGNHYLIVYAYSKIGTLSIKANDRDQAKTYLEKGLTLAEPYPQIKLQFLNALGKIYSDFHDYDKANPIYQECLAILQKEGLGKTKEVGDIHRSMGDNLIQQHKVEKAFTHLKKALPIYEQLSPDCLRESGLTHMRLAYCHEHREDQGIQQAEDHFEKGFQLFEQLNDSSLIQWALEEIIEFYDRNPNAKNRKYYENKFVKYQKMFQQ